jgi:hypothetical protein
MAEILQDRQGLFPGRAGLLRSSGRVAGVSEVAESVGGGPTAAGLAVQIDCLPIAGGRFGVLADLLVGVPEAVERAGFPLLAAEDPEQVERLLAVADRLLVIPDDRAEPADRVESLSPARQVVGGCVRLQRLPGVAEGLVLAPLIAQRDGQRVVDVGLAGVIPALLVDAESAAQMGVGIPVASDSGAGVAESLVYGGLGRPVAEPLRGRQGDLLGDSPVVPAAPHVEEI